MPMRRYTRRSTRRSYAVRSRAVRRTAMVTRKRMYRPKLYRSIGIPKQMFARLNYSTYENISLSPTFSSYYQYNLNGLFDPEVKVGGNQPYYFDQYAALYQKYLVYGCKVHVRLVASSANSNIIFPSCVIAPFTGNTPSWSTNLNMQNALGAKWRQVVPGQNGTTVVSYFNNASLAGVPKKAYTADDTYSALITANPALVNRVEINVQNYDVSATVVVQMHIKLTYYAKFFQRVAPPPS